LHDAEACVFDLTHTDLEPDIHCEWRIKYFAAIGLLRAVGHVLDKVDCTQYPQIRSITKVRYQLWRTQPEHTIFRDFIDSERNSLLKEYRFLVAPDEATAVPLVIADENGQRIVSEWSPSFLLVENGPWQDATIDELLWASVEWWQNELIVIEKCISKLP
jgi:hypothetical protein